VRRPESTDGNDHLRETLAKRKSNTDAPQASAATVGYEGQLWQMADVLRAAQRTLSGVDLLDRPGTRENLRKLSSPECHRAAGRLERAA
jgi:hypothetical protein